MINILDEFENGSSQKLDLSLGKILDKPCVHSRGHIYSQILIKLVQNVCNNGISGDFQNGPCQVKN